MKTICIARRAPVRSTYTNEVRSSARTAAHFAERGVEADFFYALDALSAGLMTTRIYDIDGPHYQRIMPPRRVGCWIAHRTLWAACLLLPDQPFLLLEDDAVFPDGWRTRFDMAIEDARGFDILYVGSCCTVGKPKRHVAGDVYEVEQPFCLHGYVVSGHRVLERLVDTLDEAQCKVHVDISVACANLRHYVVLPRILEQSDLPDLPE